MMRSLHRACFPVAALMITIASTGCGGTAEPAAPVPAATNYSLTTINGSPLPYQVDQSPDGAVTFVVTDMVLTLVDNGTWHSSGHRTVTNHGVPDVQALSGEGGYTLQGSAATFIDNNNNVVWSGSVSGNTYTLTDRLQQVDVFVKQ
jgi:hypothetical protein